MTGTTQAEPGSPTPTAEDNLRDCLRLVRGSHAILDVVSHIPTGDNDPPVPDGVYGLANEIGARLSDLNERLTDLAKTVGTV